MFKIIHTIFLIIYGFNFCATLDEVWKSYEKSFVNENREEIVVTNVTTDHNFKSQLPISKWNTLNIGARCFTVGVSSVNNSKLEILFATENESDDERFNVSSKIFDLNEPVKQTVWFHQRHDQKDNIFLIVTYKGKQKIVWYKLENQNLTSFWNWPVQYNITYIDVLKMGSRNLLAVSHDSFTENFVDIYEFKMKSEPKDYWFSSKVHLQARATSFAFNNFEDTYYLSVPQTPHSSVLIYKYENNHFISYKNLTSPKVDSVISFEILFKSFIAIDGLNAGIYQFTENGLKKDKIINSNLDGVNFWLSIPVQTYRDEVVLLAQRILDHTSHRSFDVDLVTYNGLDFEEHEDVLCLLFGEERSGLSCLTDYDSKTGISGTTYITLNGKIGLLVPRTDGHSILFMVNVMMKPKMHPRRDEMEKLKEHKTKLEAMIDDIRKQYKDIESSQLPRNVVALKLTKNKDSVATSTEEVLKEIPPTSKYHPHYLKLQKLVRKTDHIKTIVEEFLQRERDMKYDTVIINGIVHMEIGSFADVVTENIAEEAATKLLNDIVRDTKNKSVIEGYKTFTDLVVEDIHFEKVNDVLSKDFTTHNSDSIVINGNVEFILPVETQNMNSQLLNNADFEKDFVDLDIPVEELLEFDNIKIHNFLHARKVNHLKIHSNEINFSNTARNITIDGNLDSVFFPGNVTVTNINGRNLDEFVSKLCLKNIKCYIPNLSVENDILVTGNAFTNHLNDLQFPNEFVTISNQEKPIEISGLKHFSNELVAQEVYCEGPVNGINTSEILTLSTNQHVSGNLTFSNLEVLKELNVNGKIKGEHPEKFLPNFTLQHRNNIKSNVEFEKLEVLGTIFVQGAFNSSDFEAIVEDIVYKTQKEAKIKAAKQFPEGFTVRKNLNIESRKIGDTHIDSIVTTDTDQVLDITTLNGIVSFENITVEKFFGDHNITQIDQNAVKINEDKEISARLVFTQPVNAENLQILDSLNQGPVFNYLFHSGDRTIDNNITFENLKVENIFIQKDLQSNTSNFDFERFKDVVVSYTRDESINCTMVLDKSEMDFLNVEIINGINYSDLFSGERFVENMKNLLEKNTATITTLEINGSVHISKINDKNFRNFGWASPNTSQRALMIEDTVYFESLDIKNLGGVTFREFVDNMIFKDEENVDIANSLTFAKGITVKNLLETEKLNGIDVKNVLRKEGSQIIRGPVTIHGDVYLEGESDILHDINSIPLNIFENLTITENEGIVIKGDMIFRRLAHIKNLTILGLVNNKRLAETLSHIVRNDADGFLNGIVTFKDIVEVQGNLHMTNYVNNSKPSDVAASVVWATKHSEIEAPVKFSDSTEIHKLLKIQGDLDTAYLFGKKFTELSENAVFIDQGLLKGNYTFDTVFIHDSLNTEFINDINMKTVIPLKLEEDLDYLEFGELSLVNDLNVGNQINGVNLSEEYQRTVLKNSVQEITSEVVFLRHALVRQNLQTPKINQFETDKIVTTNTDQNLTAVYNFSSKCATSSNLTLNGILNDIIDFNYWKKSGLKIFSNDSQLVNGDWIVSRNLSFKENVFGTATINGYDIAKLAQNIEYKKNYKLNLKQAIINDYHNMCVDVTYLHEQSKSQIFKFRHFEELQQVSFPSSVQYVKHFEYKNQHYLWINDKSCHSYLMTFRETSFIAARRVETGHISDVVPVKVDDDLYLATTDNTQRDDEDQIICNVRGSNIWRFGGEEYLKLTFNLETQEILQESLIPATFYGLNYEYATEFKIDGSRGEVRKHRKWRLEEDNAAFIPRGLKKGLGIRTGEKLMFLNRPSKQELEDEFALGIESVFIGNVTEKPNHLIPGRNDGDLAVVNVGTKSSKKTLLAVATHRETRVFDRLDLVEIYLDPFFGTMFHKLSTYKPSSLTSIEFDNGETLLAFLENKSILQVYEYKGIEGFKHRLSAKVEGSELFLMTLPIKDYLNERKVLGIISKNKVILVEAVMSGNKIQEDLSCEL